jgi:RNA polymerase sigma factor (sigma-70 family)
MEAGALPQPGRAFLPRSRRFLGALSDERLVEQLRRGSDMAFEVIYDRHSRAILSFCRHMLGTREEAEDAVQQVFIAAYNDLLTSDRPVKLKAWLYTIARNRCLSLLRARREHAVEQIEVSTAGLADQVQDRQDVRELLNDMRRLPDDQRAALVLAELGDLSHAEIGDVLGVEPSKVKSLVFQARTTLIEYRDARAIPCHDIREQLSTLHGGALRRGPLRKHLKACEGCREFRDEVNRQRAMMAAVLPVIPTLGLKHSALAAVGLGGGASAAGGAAAGSVAGGVLSTLSSAGIATKAAVVLATGTVAVGGGVAIEHEVSSAPPSAPPASVEQGTTHRSPVAGDHAQGPPGTGVATPGAQGGASANGDTHGVRAHGAPASAHHSNPNAATGTALGGHGPNHTPGTSQGQIKRNPSGGSTTRGNSDSHTTGGQSTTREQHTSTSPDHTTGGKSSDAPANSGALPLTDGVRGNSATLPDTATGHRQVPTTP